MQADSQTSSFVGLRLSLSSSWCVCVSVRCLALCLCVAQAGVIYLAKFIFVGDVDFSMSNEARRPQSERLPVCLQRPGMIRFARLAHRRRRHPQAQSLHGFGESKLLLLRDRRCCCCCCCCSTTNKRAKKKPQGWQARGTLVVVVASSFVCLGRGEKNPSSLLSSISTCQLPFCVCVC